MPENELERALREAAEGSGAARARVYALLAQASLYVQASGPPDLMRGGMTLLTTARSGNLELAAFTGMQRALAWNPDPAVYRTRAPTSWIFAEARRLGCAAVWINPPQCEIRSADFSALAEGRVPAMTAEAPRVLAPRGAVPREALDYLPAALGRVSAISAAYVFDLVMPGEPGVLCLGLRLDLPPAQWDDFIAGLEELAEIPGFPDGVAACPLNDEMLESARRHGVRVL